LMPSPRSVSVSRSLLRVKIESLLWVGALLAYLGAALAKALAHSLDELARVFVHLEVVRAVLLLLQGLFESSQLRRKWRRRRRRGYFIKLNRKYRRELYRHIAGAVGAHHEW